MKYKLLILLLLIILGLTFLYEPMENNDEKYLSIIAIFKDETLNLKLWIDHYLWQGVDHFYMIDNGSQDNPLSILQPYIDDGKVSYYNLPEPQKQTEHYRNVYDKYIKNNTEWLIVCDMDEFFYGTETNLKNAVKKLSYKYDYIICNWLMFGNDGIVDHPKDIRKAITYREPEFHELAKYIFKTKNINSSSINIHELSDCDNIKKINNPESIRLNHYPIQSEEYFKKVKMTRGDAHFRENIRDMNYFKAYDANTVVFDNRLKKLINKSYDSYD